MRFKEILNRTGICKKLNSKLLHTLEHNTEIPKLKELSDDELAFLNELLPWAAYIVDEKGRMFGKPYSSKKRNEPQIIPDRRIVELNHRYKLANKQVLEVGCFEGIHTVALAKLGAKVSAFDGRIENVIKTLVRCWAMEAEVNVFHWNLENKKSDFVDINCDILHHVGVLYHLSNPLGHLKAILPSVKQAVMLDTHVAPDKNLHKDSQDGFIYQFTDVREPGRLAPFAGLKNYAKWLVLDDLIDFLRSYGFDNIEVAEHRMERNGPRVLIYAHR